MNAELLSLWAALIGYVVAGTIAIFGAVFRKSPEKTVLLILLCGVLLHTLALGLRWVRLGYGPFTNMYEILSSNVWSLFVFFFLIYWRIKAIRPLSPFIIPFLFMMLAWLMMVPAMDTSLPPTYDTIWLYVHIGFGKIFFGALMIATGLAVVILCREFEFFNRLTNALPGSGSLDELASRMILLALVFDSLMLVAGGIWAQDAWGRYWAWDPLETWSFVTWLSLGFLVHFRITFPRLPWVYSTLTLCVFVVSFMTFFGLPFINTIPHKGAI